MQSIQKYILLVFILVMGASAQAQNPKIDQLEMLFAQKHYRKVYRKANRLLDNPEYDFSVMPSYYKSLSLLQLAQNDYWLSKHSNAISEAKKALILTRRSANGPAIFKAHQNELAWLKEDLMSWASDLKRMGNEKAFLEVQSLLKELFSQIIIIEKESTVEIPNVPIDPALSSATGDRSNVVVSAEQHIGTPYVWAGSSPEGFDCSGFTSYVMSEFGVQLPRRAEDQYKMAKKVKKKNVQKGDLVFFKNGGSISHVGIVISEKGEAVVMIHASSSRGIITTQINQSSYWSQRLYSFGSILD